MRRPCPIEWGATAERKEGAPDGGGNGSGGGGDKGKGDGSGPTVVEIVVLVATVVTVAGGEVTDEGNGAMFNV